MQKLFKCHAKKQIWKHEKKVKRHEGYNEFYHIFNLSSRKREQKLEIRIEIEYRKI